MALFGLISSDHYPTAYTVGEIRNLSKEIRSQKRSWLNRHIVMRQCAARSGLTSALDVLLFAGNGISQIWREDGSMRVARKSFEKSGKYLITCVYTLAIGTLFCPEELPGLHRDLELTPKDGLFSRGFRVIKNNWRWPTVLLITSAAIHFWRYPTDWDAFVAAAATHKDSMIQAVKDDYTWVKGGVEAFSQYKYIKPLTDYVILPLNDWVITPANDWVVTPVTGRIVTPIYNKAADLIQKVDVTIWKSLGIGTATTVVSRFVYREISGQKHDDSQKA